jgi:hypothetical protein
MSLAYVIVDVFTDTPLQGNRSATRYRRSAACPGSGLIPITLGEVRRLLAHLITTHPGRAATWAWSHWRRRHQHRAKTSHYQRRQIKYNKVRLEY